MAPTVGLDLYGVSWALPFTCDEVFVYVGKDGGAVLKAGE